jgi:MFS family permease
MGMTSESATTTHLPHERPFRVLRHRDFRLIWSADFLSQTGTQVQRVAVAWQVFQMTHDPLQLGLLGLARFVPLFLFGLAGGVLADRYDRRKMLILAELALATIAASFTWLTAVDLINMVWIFALTALSATFGAVAGPTRQALVPALVPRPSMPAAMTMDVLTFQAAGMVGPAIGGALVASSGIAVSYAVDAATFAGVALAALALQARPRQAEIVGGGWEAAREGLRFLRESPVLLGTMALDFLADFFGASTTLMPIFAADVLGGGPGTLGLLLAAPAVGAVSGATILASARALSRPGLGILGAVVVYGLALAGFAFSTNLWLSLVLLAVSGVADSVSVSQRHTLRNMVTPDRLRGRISAAHSTFAGGGPQLGEFEAGIVASLTSAPIAVAVGGLGTVAAAAVIARRVPGLIGLRWRVADARDETPNRGATRPIVARAIAFQPAKSLSK